MGGLTILLVAGAALLLLQFCMDRRDLLSPIAENPVPATQEPSAQPPSGPEFAHDNPPEAAAVQPEVKLELPPEPLPEPVDIATPLERVPAPAPPPLEPPTETKPVERPKGNKASAPPRPTKAPASKACPAPVRLPGDEPEVILVFDGSGSMADPFAGTTRMQAAKNSAADLIRALPGGIDIGVVNFADCSTINRERFYATNERAALISSILGINPMGGTPLARAIQRAGNVSSGQAPAYIVVVSDGDDSCGGDPCAVARALKASKPNVIINPINLSGSLNATLQCVANATGGKVLTPQSVPEMSAQMRVASGQAGGSDCN
jgi:hypothetical protein